MTDYFPLVKGAVREYSYENSQGTGGFSVEILSILIQGATTTAKCRRTLNLPGEPEKIAEFTLTKDASGVHEGGAFEFKNPLAVGTEWISPPRRYWIEALDAVVETPAGKFKDCLRVAYLIAEGDGGSGERFYAPGVGLVKAVDNDEAEPSSFELVKAA
ncbi:MAG: hypothetical protein Q8T11_10415 [Elusimicrobiota bacterium]|nr:hypothetical protein [Elusimicrobiota bacterium]